MERPMKDKRVRRGSDKEGRTHVEEKEKRKNEKRRKGGTGRLGKRR